jgi:hypothetical protein
MRTLHRSALAVTAGLLGTACVMTGVARAAIAGGAEHATAAAAAAAPRYLDCPLPSGPAARAAGPSRTGSAVSGKNGTVRIPAKLTYAAGVVIRLGADGAPAEELTNTGAAPGCSLIAGGTVWVYAAGDPAGHLVTSLAEKQRLLNAANFAGDPAAWNPGEWYPVSS